MKKLLFIILPLIILNTACDYNERNFEGLDEMSALGNIYQGEYTITDADYPAIISALNASGDPLAAEWATALNRDKSFSDEAPAGQIIPYYLKKIYYTADKGSSIYVTYNNRDKSNATAFTLAGESYMVNAAGYQSVWGTPHVESFTPEKPAGQYLPKILESAVSSPTDNMYIHTEYYYSAEEPVTANVEQTVLEELFEDYTTVNDAINLNGWTQYQESGTYNYQAKSFNNNRYAQISNGSSGQKITWLISPEIDLETLSEPHLTFDVKVGYWKASCLEIKISADYDGTNVREATWTDITSLFTLPVTPTDGYGGVFENAGEVALSDFAGNKVHIAFRYNGDADAEPARTTTYQLDNIKIGETISGIEIREKSLCYAVWKYDGSAKTWKQAGNDVLFLQPADYKTMGLSYLSTDEASHYIPTWLRNNHPYAKQDDVYTVVFKSGTRNTASGRYIFNNGNWEAESDMTSKTDQFILSSQGWIFDPTVVVTFAEKDYQVLVDYVIAHYANENPDLVHSRNNAEYYYGFAAFYQNVTYRESDRQKDPAYPSEGTDAEKAAFMNERTIEGLELYLSLTMPHLQPDVNGVEQLARLTVLIYNDPLSNRQNVTWAYTLRCTEPGSWEFVQRESDDGVVETAL